jgi:hypothetical protein
LCKKQYTRANELAAHEVSYEHTHAQRLRDLKAASRPDNAARERARRREERESGIRRIANDDEPQKVTKGGWKSVSDSATKPTEEDLVSKAGFKPVLVASTNAYDPSKIDGKDYDCYRPGQISECGPDCPGLMT